MILYIINVILMKQLVRKLNYLNKQKIRYYKEKIIKEKQPVLSIVIPCYNVENI